MTNFEIKIVNWVRQIISPFLDKVLEIVTMLGEQNILIIIIIIIYFIFSKKEAQRIAFAVFSSLLLNNAVKGVLARVRPFNHPLHTFDDASRIQTATGYSFPSGHTQNAAVSYTAIGLNYKKKWLWILVSIIIFLVAISRVGLGVHYPSDVIFGVLLGVGVAFLADKLFRKIENNFSHQIIALIVVALIFFPFIIIFLRDTYEEAIVFKDFYSSYAFFLGYIGAVVCEKHFVDFDTKNPIKIKIIRTVIAIIIVVLIQFGLKALFPSESIPFDMIRYFLSSFITLGLYPIVCNKLLFNKVDT